MSRSKRIIPFATAPSPAKATSLLHPDRATTAQVLRVVMNRFVEFINSASETLAKELVSRDAIFHVPGQSKPMRGPEGYMAILKMMRSGFPDIQWSLEETIIENDYVAARFTMRGTHKGEFFGVPATGRKIAVQALNIYRWSNGQIVEERGQPDMLGLLQQIGALPSPAANSELPSR